MNESYEASAFHPDLPGGRGPGTLRIESGRVRFTSGDDGGPTFDLPFRDLEMRLGGAGDRLVFFTHPDLADVSVYTADHRVLAHPELAAQAGVAAQVRRVRGRKRRLRLAFAATLTALALAVVGLVVAKDPLVGFVADRVPARVEVELGDLLFKQVRASTRLIGDPEIEARLDELVAPLVAAVPDAGYPFDFHVAEDPTLNAFAVPGGHVVLHSGLLLEAESADEVLGVVAHEIAHVTRRHSLRQIVSAAGVFVVFQTLFGDLTGLAAVIADGGLQLLTLEFSRQHERDADDTGFDYLVAAGLDPRGMVAFFARLRDEQELGDLEEGLAFLSTHPATAERIAHLEGRLAELAPPSRPAATFDFAAFQDILRQEVSHSTPGG